MAFHGHNSSWYLPIPFTVLVIVGSASEGVSQQFTTPEVPISQTMDGQTYGVLPGDLGSNRGIDNHVFEGRVFEGRVLTGPNGQPGDRTLRFPPNDSLGQNVNDSATVFGPIEIEPLPPVTAEQIPTRRALQNPSDAALRRTKQRPDLLEIPNREIIRQRYPDGNVHIARHVMQDADGNWVNDGQWKLFDQQGAMIASGAYRNGAMAGKWSRLHAAGSGGIFNNLPFIEFDGPYASHAVFESGKLSGTWVIEDRRGQKIFEMPYQNGRRNGVAVWHLPEGKIFRRMEFKDDVPVGNLVEYNKQGKISRKETYKDGMKIVSNVTYYRPSGQKRQESILRRGKLELQGQDDWWEAKPATMIVTGQDVQHGPIRSWYENGQTKMVGNLVQGVRVGKFVWWHQNGTKQLVGQYDRSGNKVQRWRWWHDNGIKSIDGGYDQGQPDGTWRWWDIQGALINEEEFNPEDETAVAISIDALESDFDGSQEAPTVETEVAPSTESSDGAAIQTRAQQSATSAPRPDTALPDSNPPNTNLPNTDLLEGIEPESIDAEEMPEPDMARNTLPVASEAGAEVEIESFFRIQDDL